MKMMRATTERQMSAAAPGEYLKRPYGRVVVPEPDGTFRAEIMEFPGCIATGDTAAEALASLENVAESWLEATIARGQHVPEPIENGLDAEPDEARRSLKRLSVGCRRPWPRSTPTSA